MYRCMEHKRAYSCTQTQPLHMHTRAHTHAHIYTNTYTNTTHGHIQSAHTYTVFSFLSFSLTHTSAHQPSFSLHQPTHTQTHLSRKHSHCRRLTVLRSAFSGVHPSSSLHSPTADKSSLSASTTSVSRWVRNTGPSISCSCRTRPVRIPICPASIHLPLIFENLS